VPRQCEGRRTISIQRVTFLALIEIGRRGELRLVLVLVTIGALGKFDFVQRGPARRHVTSLALHRRVLPLERVRARGVFFHRE